MIIHKRTISFPPESFTADGNVKASALQYELQEIGGEHAALLGLGYEAMLRDNQIWVITKLKYRLLQPIVPNADYTLVTFPKPKRGMLYQRDYQIFAADGSLAALAISQWCIMDFVSRKIVRSPKDFEGEFNPEILFPEGFDRFRPTELIPAGSYTVTEADLDGNAHTNNCRYADMIERVIPGKSPTDFSITFAKETRLGDTIRLFISHEPDGKTIVSGTVEDQTVFSALF